MSQIISKVSNYPKGYEKIFDEVSAKALKALEDKNNIQISRKEVVATIANVFIEQLIEYCKAHKGKINFFNLFSIEVKNDNGNRNLEILSRTVAWKKLKFNKK